MIPALWISKTGLDAQQTNISVTSNNLANASTVGFKRGRAVFEDLLYQKINQPGGRSSADSYLPEGLMIGSGAKVVATQRQFSQGDVETTDNSFDLMIQGRGMTTLAFMPLGLPADHPFWTDAAQPWTQVKAWDNQQFPKDHHWNDEIVTKDKW